MCDNLFEVEVETVDVYDFELCSMARGINANSLVKIVSLYRQSEERLLERLRLTEEAFFLTANKIQNKQQHMDDMPPVVVVPPAVVQKELPSMEKIRSVKVHESARKLRVVINMVLNCGVQRCAFVFKVEHSKIIELVSRYRIAMGFRLERLLNKEESFLEKREFVQQYDIKQIRQEWDQIYALLNEIAPTKD